MWEKTEKKILKSLSGSRDVKYFVDGECVSPGMAWEVAENENYMADYVIGKEGGIAEIRFDRIDPE